MKLAIPEKIQTGRVLRIYFFEPPPPPPPPSPPPAHTPPNTHTPHPPPPHGISHFFILPLEIPDKAKVNPWIFYKIVLDISWKFQSLIERPLEIPHLHDFLALAGHPCLPEFHFVFN